MKLVKICGLTKEEEAAYVNEAGADFAGMVLFVPKSKRNISVEQAKTIIRRLEKRVKSVAVTISPTAQQLSEIQQAGFDYVQVHGELEEALLNSLNIPVIKAFNVSDLSQYQRFRDNPHVAGYVFDAQVPGSGKTFDWSTLTALPRDDKFALLAGGLNPDNVAEALSATGLSGADTSSGVENSDGNGKSREKIKEFVKRVKTCV
jgi:phosphoribosylanthranilate isomerase